MFEINLYVCTYICYSENGLTFWLQILSHSIFWSSVTDRCNLYLHISAAIFRQHYVAFNTVTKYLTRMTVQRKPPTTTKQFPAVLWSRDHGLETRVHSSSFCPGLGLGLETWWPRSRSWSQDSMLGAYACSTITVICSTFKRVLCRQLEFMQPVLWSRDHDLETRVHSSSFCLVSLSVSRPEVQGLKT